MQLILFNTTGGTKTYLSGAISVASGGSTSVTNTVQQLALATDGTLRSDILANNIYLTDGTNTFGNNDGIAYLYELVQNIGPISDGSGNSITSSALNNQRLLDVNVASNQDHNGTGTIAALNGTVVMITNGCSTAQLNITGTWVATLSFEGLLNATWVSISADIDATDSIMTSVSVNSFVTINCGGFSQIRVRASAYTSGTSTIDWNAGIGTALVEVFNGNGQQLKVKDIIDSAAQGRAQSVTTTAAEALGGSVRLVNRKYIEITPTNGTVYWGFTSGVTVSTGTPIFKNQTFLRAFTDNIPIYVISATTVDCRISEGS